MASKKTVMAFALVLNASSTWADPPRSVERPEVVIGESWTYAGYENETRFTLKFEIERVSDKEIQAVVTPNGFAQLAQVHVFDRQWNQVETLKGGNRIVQYSPYRPAFKFPLQVGKTWAQNYDWQKMVVGGESPRAKTWAESQERKANGPRDQAPPGWKARFWAGKRSR